MPAKDHELNELIESIVINGMQLMEKMAKEPAQFFAFIIPIISLFYHLQAVLVKIYSRPDKIWPIYLKYAQDANQLTVDQLALYIRPLTEGKRGKDNFLKQHYDLVATYFNALITELDYNDQSLAKKLEFFAKQFFAALSPDNFLHSNPQLLITTMTSNGKNLLRGLHNFFNDLQESAGHSLIIKTADFNAFKIGVNIATTPGKVIYRNEIMELILFAPQTAKVKSIPLLIIPPWINKYYILDLSKDNSFIGWLVAQGILVFVISWINPDAKYADIGLDDYLVRGALIAITIILQQLTITKVNLLGFCIGGTLLACLLAYLKTCNLNYASSATFLASMIDFSNSGELDVFIDEEQIARIETAMIKQGFFPGNIMTTVFNSLRAKELIWTYFVNNYLQGKKPAPFDILYWNADATNMPARMHSEYLRWLYLNNALVMPDMIKLDKVPIDLNKIDLPTFFVATRKDHIAPWEAIYLGLQRLNNSKKRFLLGDSGHIAGIINPPIKQKYGFYRNLNIYPTSTEWLAHASYHQGSWWPEWFLWLKIQSGRSITCPKLAALFADALMDAPGNYVLKKC